MTTSKHYILAEPHGMCGGVRRALDKVAALPGGVYVLHEIVHNNFIVGELRKRGILFVDTLEEVPPGSTVVFSAHGVSRAVEATAAGRQLRVIDASCPLVKSIHHAAAAGVEAGALVLLIGHRGHPEVEGILGQAADGRIHLVESEADLATLPPAAAGQEVRLITQTTLDTAFVEHLRSLLTRQYPALIDDGGICYATRDRQNAVRQLAQQVDLMLVIGSLRSSNSNRLGEVAAPYCRVIRLDLPEELTEEALEHAARIGVAAGASVPDELVARLIARLESCGYHKQSAR